MEKQIENILIKVDEGTMPVQQALNELLLLFSVSGRSEQLVNFLLHLNDKELINNHDFDYEKEAKKYLKKIN